jgi:hypothetical protein
VRRRRIESFPQDHRSNLQKNPGKPQKPSRSVSNLHRRSVNKINGESSEITSPETCSFEEE